MKNIYRTLNILFVTAIVVALVSSCVSNKKYDEALSRIAELEVDNTFEEQTLADVAYEKDGVIYKQNKALIVKSQKLDSMVRLYDDRAVNLKQTVTLLDKVKSSSWSTEEINGTVMIRLSEDILYKVGQSKLKESGMKTINELVATLKTMSLDQVWVVGNTDKKTISAENYNNWDLSSQRATIVVKAMIKAGLQPTLLTAAGRAEYNPVSENNPALNRRTEIILIPNDDLEAAIKPFVSK